MSPTHRILVGWRRPLSLSPLFTLCLIGCGGGGAETPVVEPAAPATQHPAVSTPAAVTASDDTDVGRSRRQNERWKDANGVEYLGDVPLDVFFDQPHMVASNTTPLNGSPVSVPETTQGSETAIAATMPNGAEPETSATGTETEPEPAEPAGKSWEELIPMEVLTSEINSTRNFLNQTLQSVGSYNRSMLMVPPKAASMAVLSGVVMEYPVDINWKEDAIYVRDLARQMNESTLQPGKKDQDRLLRLFESMASILDRSRPAGLNEPEPEDSFADTAEMRFVMMRMAEAQKRMKDEAGTESAFSSKKDLINHEAAILGTMTHVVTLPGYGYADDAEFLGYAKKISDAAREIRNAATASDFNSYELSLSRISTACQECHSAYKNN